jgi:hypothetical protein
MRDVGIFASDFPMQTNRNRGLLGSGAAGKRTFAFAMLADFFSSRVLKCF